MELIKIKTQTYIYILNYLSELCYTGLRFF